MGLHALREWPALRAILRAVACAAPLCTVATSAPAGPRVGLELQGQHVRVQGDEFFEPKGFPISGGATVTFRWRPYAVVDLVTGLGYEELATAGESYVVYYGQHSFPGYSFDVQQQWRSAVIPLHAGVDVGPLRLRLGPEWRWLLQKRSRAENIRVPLVARAARAEFGPWHDETSRYYPASLAFATEAGVHWRWFRGDAGVGLRWCKGLGYSPLDSAERTSRMQAFQLVTSWDR